MGDAEFAAADEWCAENRVACLYYLCPSSERDSARLACGRGFECVDVRVDLETEPSNADGRGGSVRLFQPGDLAALRAIARASHTDSRFYADPRFPRAACDRLYGIWIEKSCAGDAGAVWVAEESGSAAGYITCHKEDGGIGRIGLLAVRSDLRGRGAGRELVAGAMAWFAEQGCSGVRVATQAGNGGALRFYGRAGFRPVEVGLWFHKWYA